MTPADSQAAAVQPQIGTRGVPAIEADRLRFRGLNRNGQLDAYEDWRLSADRRASTILPSLRHREIRR